jgi:WD40 repeat protein
MAALALGSLYFVGSSKDQSERHISLGESAVRTSALAFGPGDELLVSTILDGAARAWRIPPGTDRAPSSELVVPGFTSAFSPDGLTLAVGDDSAVILAETSQDRPRRTLRTDDGPTCALAFSHDGKKFAAAGARGVTVGETAVGGRQVLTRIGLRDVISLAFGTDHESLLTGGKDGWVRFWDLHTVRERCALRAHASNVTSLRVSGDGRTLASASKSDMEARLWDVATGHEQATLVGHTAPVQTVAFGIGGTVVATAGMDRTVRLWDVATGRELALLRCSEMTPNTLAFSPDGRSLVAGGHEPRIQIWTLSDIPGL